MKFQIWENAETGKQTRCRRYRRSQIPSARRQTILENEKRSRPYFACPSRSADLLSTRNSFDHHSTAVASSSGHDSKFTTLLNLSTARALRAQFFHAIPRTCAVTRAHGIAETENIQFNFENLQFSFDEDFLVRNLSLEHRIIRRSSLQQPPASNSHAEF